MNYAGDYAILLLSLIIDAMLEPRQPFTFDGAIHTPVML